MRSFYLMFALMFAACEAEVPLHCVASPPVSAPDPATERRRVVLSAHEPYRGRRTR